MVTPKRTNLTALSKHANMRMSVQGRFPLRIRQAIFRLAIGASIWGSITHLLVNCAEYDAATQRSRDGCSIHLRCGMTRTAGVAYFRFFAIESEVALIRFRMLDSTANDFVYASK